MKTQYDNKQCETSASNLTEIESLISLGFKEEDIEKCKAMGVSKTQLYRCVENSIVTNCVKLLAQHLYKAQYDISYICEDETMVSQGYGV